MWDNFKNFNFDKTSNVSKTFNLNCSSSKVYKRFWQFQESKIHQNQDLCLSNLTKLNMPQIRNLYKSQNPISEKCKILGQSKIPCYATKEDMQYLIDFAQSVTAVTSEFHAYEL